MKKKRRIVIIVIAAVAVMANILAAIAGIFATVWFTCLDPYRGTDNSGTKSLPLDTVVTKEQALEDIDYAMNLMRKRHPAWLEDDEPKVADVEACYVKEREALPDSPTCLDVLIAISHIMHELYDGHTCVYPVSPEPLYVDDFTEFRSGATLVAINGEPLSDIFERFLAVYQYEVEDYAFNVMCGNVVVNKDYLTWVGVDTTEPVTYTFEDEDGRRNVEYCFVPITEVKGLDSSEFDEDWVRYDIYRDRDVAVFTLTTCICDEHYKETVKSFFEEVERLGINNVAVDLRNNGGGNSLVGDEFIKYLDVDSYKTWPCHVRYGNFLYKSDGGIMKNHRKKPSFEGNVYVLTNVGTFSAAKDFTMMISDNDLGKVIGEASGNLPDTYGDCLVFVTPNTKLSFNISYKRWYRIDRTKAGQRIMPDYPCDPADALDKLFELTTNGD